MDAADGVHVRALRGGLAAIKAAADPKDREALADAMRAMRTDTIVGPLDFGAGPAPNVAFTPVFPTQWQPAPGSTPTSW